MKKNIYLSNLAGDSLIKYLRYHGFELVFMTGKSADGKSSPVYKEVSTHADIHMCQLGLWENSALFPGNIDKLESNYPGNIIYNAVCTGKYFIHNMKYTDPELFHAVQKWHKDNFPDETLNEISVPQGYTRCCCLPVDNSSFVTSDEGIANAMKKTDADVLLIEKGHILLPGFDYGFIGGCAGHILIQGKPTIIFNGNLKQHPDYKNITTFIKSRDIDIVFFEDYELTDIGSILIG